MMRIKRIKRLKKLGKYTDSASEAHRVGAIEQQLEIHSANGEVLGQAGVGHCELGVVPGGRPSRAVVAARSRRP